MTGGRNPPACPLQPHTRLIAAAGPPADLPLGMIQRLTATLGPRLEEFCRSPAAGVGWGRGVNDEVNSSWHRLKLKRKFKKKARFLVLHIFILLSVCHLCSRCVPPPPAARTQSASDEEAMAFLGRVKLTNLPTTDLPKACPPPAQDGSWPSSFSAYKPLLSSCFFPPQLKQ